MDCAILRAVYALLFAVTITTGVMAQNSPNGDNQEPSIDELREGNEQISLEYQDLVIEIHIDQDDPDSLNLVIMGDEVLCLMSAFPEGPDQVRLHFFSGEWSTGFVISHELFHEYKEQLISNRQGVVVDPLMMIIEGLEDAEIISLRQNGEILSRFRVQVQEGQVVHISSWNTVEIYANYQIDVSRFQIGELEAYRFGLWIEEASGIDSGLRETIRPVTYQDWSYGLLQQFAVPALRGEDPLVHHFLVPLPARLGAMENDPRLSTR